MTSKQKKLVKYILWICILAVAVKMIYTFVSSQTIDSYGLFAISIFIASLLELYTFGKITYLGASSGEQSDEMEEHIVKVSSKISYFALMIIVLVIIVASEFTEGGGMSNIPLMFVFCATIVTLPFVQFLVAKKYR